MAAEDVGCMNIPDQSGYEHADTERKRHCVGDSIDGDGLVAANEHWPSIASLYAQGLQSRAQALPAHSFIVQGVQWRQRHLLSVDVDKTELKQRQQDARRAMLGRK